MENKTLLIILSILLVLMMIPAVVAQPKDRIPPGQARDTPSEPIGTAEPNVIYVNQTISSAEEGGIDWEMVAVIIVVIGGIASWIISRLVRGKTAKYMTEIDRAYRSYRQNTNKCEAELTNLREKIDYDFKKGKLTDRALEILEKRIDKYSKELRSGIIDGRFELPKNLSRLIKNMLADGVITKDEYVHFKEIVKKANLNSSDKAELSRLMKRWKEIDKK